MRRMPHTRPTVPQAEKVYLTLLAADGTRSSEIELAKEVGNTINFERGAVS